MLKLENIKKSYDDTTVLDGINLEIQDGEIVSILGPSGCGKTTLLNLILGITDIDSGKILYNYFTIFCKKSKYFSEDFLPLRLSFSGRKEFYEKK